MYETPRVITAILLTLLWLLWCVGLYVRHRRTRPKLNKAASTLIAYASQSGAAAALATQKAQQLGSSDKVNLLPLDRVCQQILRTTKQAHFVVSTYGNGEPPDNGQRFYHAIQSKKLAVDLSHMRYSVTALGDSNYAHFCAFGHNLHRSLAKLGAQSESEVVELDSQKSTPVQSEHATTEYFSWRLIERTRLNPNSLNAPLFLLTFNSETEIPKWRAGDVVSVQPCNSKKHIESWLEKHQVNGDVTLNKGDKAFSLKQHLRSHELPNQPPEGDLTHWLKTLPPLPHRDYSIASAQHEIQLKLIVRLQTHANGQPGIGSGWLTQFSEINDITRGKIRANSRCHIDNATRPLLLIGAGSGLAGLRAQLAERSLMNNAGKVWVIYGERHPVTDTMLNNELMGWRNQGVITDIDFAYSQHPESPKYVQDVLQANNKKLKAMIHQGADIYICGNKTGMGDSVHQAFIKFLGQDNVSALLANGRYRRDLY